MALRGGEAGLRTESKATDIKVYRKNDPALLAGCSHVGEGCIVVSLAGGSRPLLIQGLLKLMPAQAFTGGRVARSC